VKLHPYQEIGVLHLRAHPRAGLFLDMGLGKTATTLRALTPAHLPALVVAPRRVVDLVWPTEMALWRPDLKLGRDIDVVSRDSLHRVTDPGKYRTIILDELSSFKNRSSNRWKLARKITDQAPHVWGLTGTPAPNGLQDLWAQMYLLDKGQRLGTGVGAYRARFFRQGLRRKDGTFQVGGRLPNGAMPHLELLPGAADTIYGLIEDICLSMRAATLLDLPPATVNVVPVQLPPQVRQRYRTLKKNLTADFSLLGGSVLTAANAAVATAKLSQLTAGIIIDEQQVTRLHTEKLAALQEVVDGTGGSPVLVFYRFREEAAMIREAFPKAATLDDPDIMARWNAGEVPLLLAHPASAGHGLNLQHGGHTIVWTTLPWSSEEWEQANGRLARQGQKHPVVVHVLQAERTIDEAQLLVLRDKVRVQNALMNHLESPL